MSVEPFEKPAKPANATGEGEAIRFRLRKDLIVVEQLASRQKKWAVKDPLSLEFFHFGEHEWFVLKCLDGRTSIEEIQTQFRQQFPPLKIAQEEIKVFLSRALQDNLVILDGKFGQGHGLLKQAKDKKKNEIRFRWTQILYIRFRGMDPNGLLSLLQPIGNVLFHPMFMALSAMSMCLTIAFIIAQFDEVSTRWPDTVELFTTRNLLLMALVIGVVKVLHELGHGLACRRLGGECRELGVLLLAFVPCLYCNVSDTWLEPSKWKRMMVSAAGIYVELILATISFVLWFASYPGTLNSICLNVVVICSINTVFINGNPLLRYDGYYLLADFVDIPNLAQQAKSALGYRIKSLFFWMPTPEASSSSSDAFLLTYAVTSLAYRIFVIIAILFGVHVATKANEIEIIGNLAITVAMFGIFLPLIYRTVKTMQLGFGKMKLRKLSSFLVLVICISIIIAIARVPFPFEFKAPAVIELRDSTTVFAPRAGRLQWKVRQGDFVQKGEPVASIENFDLLERRGLIETSVSEKSTRLENLQVRSKEEPEQIAELPILQTELIELEKQLRAIDREVDGLILRAPRSGVVFPGPPRRQQLDPRVFLNQWHGSLLDPQNSGCFVERGQLLCVIAKPEEIRAAVYVDQYWVDEVASGTRVQFCFDQAVQTIVEGTVTNVVGEAIGQVPDSLIANRMISVVEDDSGEAVPAEPLFRVDCKFVNNSPNALPGSTGKAKIVITDKTAMERITRFIDRTFRIDW